MTILLIIAFWYLLGYLLICILEQRAIIIEQRRKMQAVANILDGSYVINKEIFAQGNRIEMGGKVFVEQAKEAAEWPEYIEG